MHSQPYTLDRVVRLVITLAIIAGVIWLINVLKGVLLPFCVACLLAYLFEPFVQFNRKLLGLKGRVAAIFVTLFEALFFAGALAYFVVPQIIQEMEQMSVILQKYANSEMHIRFLPGEIHDFLKRHVDFKQLSSMLTSSEWALMIENTISMTWSLITGSISVLIDILSWLFVFVYLIFIMIDYDRLNKIFQHMIPPKMRPIVNTIGNDVKHSMNHYFRGQALVASIVGVLFAIGFSIIGLPMGIVLGLFIGLLNMVPYLQLISIPMTAFLCLMYSAGGDGDFWPIFVECMILYAVIQCFQDLFLTPKIMGKAMGLNPAIILLSLSIWGTLLGFIGLIIALPLTTLLLAYYDRYIIGSGNSRTRAVK